MHAYSLHEWVKTTELIEMLDISLLSVILKFLPEQYFYSYSNFFCQRNFITQINKLWFFLSFNKIIHAKKYIKDIHNLFLCFLSTCVSFQFKIQNKTLFVFFSLKYYNNFLVILVEKYNFKIKKFPGTKNATYIALKQR